MTVTLEVLPSGSGTDLTTENEIVCMKGVRVIEAFVTDVVRKAEGTGSSHGSDAIRNSRPLVLMYLRDE